MLTINLKNAHPRIALIFADALPALLTLMTPNAEAQKRPQKTLPTGIQIVGHSDLDGIRVLKIFLQEQQGRWYLYAGHASERGFTLVGLEGHPRGRDQMELPPSVTIAAAPRPEKSTW